MLLGGQHGLWVQHDAACNARPKQRKASLQPNGRQHAAACASSRPRQGRRSAVHVAAQPASAAAAAAAEGMSPGKLAWAAAAFPSGPPPLPLSRGDADFADIGVEFVEGCEGIKVTELNELFEKVGFPRREPTRLKVALEHSHRVIWVRSAKQSRVARLGQLLGFARATSDGVFNATIWDVSVAPAWQREGLGRALMERLTRRLVEDGITNINLYAEAKVVGLYKKLGFASDVEGIKGMAFQRRSPPGGAKQAGVAAASSRR